MNRTYLLAASATALVGVAAAALVQGRTARPMHDVAHAFLMSLTPEQKAKATFAFDSEERFNWHFIPRERKGLPWAEMTPEQEKAAIALLRASLSATGYKKADTIRSLETVLKEIEKGSGPVRDPQRYFFSLFGNPAPKGVWGWRYEGHHLSLQWTMVNGKVAASSPQFFGTNPGEVRIEHPLKGTRVLAAEEDLGYMLVRSFDEAKRKEAVLSEKAPDDILTSAQRKAAIQEDKGVAYSAMNADQKSLLWRIIEEYANAQPEKVARERMDKVKKAGLDTVKFAWMGSLEPNKGHYYRVQGKTFLIEFDNTQNNANHVHCVWRDFNGDFGADLLAEHYKSVDHSHGHDLAEKSRKAAHTHTHGARTHTHN